MTRLFLTWTVSLSLTAFTVFGQPTGKIGQLTFTDCKIKHKEKTVDTIAGQPTKVLRLTITAKAKAQISCNYGDPSKNKYKTVRIKVAVSYAYDSTGIIHDSIINEIKKYIIEQEAWAKKYNTGNDFSHLSFLKSFFLKDSVAVPYIRTMGENPGDYAIFYIDNQVYKIELLSRHGYGNLSLFIFQSMYFTKDNKQLDLGDYIKNLDKVKEILSKVK